MLVSRFSAHHALPRASCSCSGDFPSAGVVVTILSGIAIFARPESALWGLLQEEVESEDANALAMAQRCRRAEGGRAQRGRGAEGQRGR